MSATELVQYEMQGTQPDNFTMLPNMAFEDLSPNAFKLLAIYLDTASTTQVYAKNSTITKKLGVSSVNTMKRARKELADKGYIIYAPGKDGSDTTTARVVIQVAWMWSENHKRMSKNDTPEEITEGTVSKNDTMVSNIDTPVSKNDTNNQYLKNKEPKKEKSSKAPTPVLDDFQKKQKLLVDSGVLVKTWEFIRFKDEADDYTFEQWQEGINRLVERLTKDPTRKNYKYLLEIMKDVEAEAKQAALVKVENDALIQANRRAAETMRLMKAEMDSWKDAG